MTPIGTYRVDRAINTRVSANVNVVFAVGRDIGMIALCLLTMRKKKAKMKMKKKKRRTKKKKRRRTTKSMNNKYVRTLLNNFRKK